MIKIIPTCVILLFMSCVSNENNSSSFYTMKSTDTVELGKWIQIPYSISKTEWQVNRIGNGKLGPSDLIFIGKIEFQETLPVKNIDTISCSRCSITKEEAQNFNDIELYCYLVGNVDVYQLNKKCYTAKMFFKNSFTEGFFMIFDNGKTIFLKLQSI